MLIRRRTSEKVKRGGRQRILIGPPIDVCTHQLFRRGIGEGAHGEVGHGESTDVNKWSRNAKVGQQDPPLAVLGIGEQDVRRLDVAVQQAPAVGVVECGGDTGDDVAYVVYRHPGRVAAFEQLRGVGAVDVVHRDPEVTIDLAAIVHRDDVRVPQRAGQVGFALKPFPEVAVRCYRLGQDF